MIEVCIGRPVIHGVVLRCECAYQYIEDGIGVAFCEVCGRLLATSDVYGRDHIPTDAAIEWGPQPVLQRHRAPPFVYFAAAADGTIKIGTSRSVKARVSAIGTQERTRMRLLATMPGSFDVERATHARFAASRIRGEWFRPTPDLLAFIDTLARDAQAAA